MADWREEYRQKLNNEEMFRTFVDSFPCPFVPTFKPGQGSSQEERDAWIYHSGRWRLYEHFYEHLTGIKPVHHNGRNNIIEND